MLSLELSARFHAHRFPAPEAATKALMQNQLTFS